MDLQEVTFTVGKWAFPCRWTKDVKKLAICGSWQRIEGPTRWHLHSWQVGFPLVHNKGCEEGSWLVPFCMMSCGKGR